MKNVNAWIVAVCVGTLFGHYVLYSQRKIDDLQMSVNLSNAARDIESETIRDLMHANVELSQEKLGIETKAYVAGVVATIKQPEHQESIWHNGYDRGTEVQMLASQFDKKILDDQKPQDIKK